MVKQLEDSMREMICRKYDMSKSCIVIAQELEISYRTIASVLSLYRKTGRVKAIRKRQPKARTINQEIENFIKEIVAEDACLTLKQIQIRVSAAHGIYVSISTLHRTIENFTYSFKRISLIPVQRNTERTIDIRYEYARSMLLENEEKIIYLDEMGINCSMRRKYGRSPVGTTPRKTVTSIRARNYSVSAAISKRGLLHFEVRDVAYDGERYGEFLQQLFTELSRLGHSNMLLVMDNCSMHKTDLNKSLITDAGHRFMFLPPYTPQLNPIEEVFSKWKTLVMSRNCMNAEDLLGALNTEHRNIGVTDCENYIMHSRTFLVQALEKIQF